ncbi:hypothetical protein EI94DRAFT_1790970 [Lactarius quietus]|nr:hypothetical protein EI94DRAFT_1790970 [Lactarius quietus]
MSRNSQDHDLEELEDTDGAQIEAIDARIDGSDEIFTLYLEIFLREDEKMIETWNQDAKSIMLFRVHRLTEYDPEERIVLCHNCGRSLGANLSLVPDLTSSSQDVSAAYLQLIYDQFVSFNGSQPDSIDYGSEQGSESSLDFQLVNSLVTWFSSLVISLTCALLALAGTSWTFENGTLRVTKHEFMSRSKTPETFTKRSPEVTDWNSNGLSFRKLSPGGMRKAIEASTTSSNGSSLVFLTFTTQEQLKIPRSHSVSESTRQQRIKICTGVIDAVPTLVSWSTSHRIPGEWERLLESVDFGSAVLRTGGDCNRGPRTVCYARCIVAIVIARKQRNGGSWTNLATQFFASNIEGWVGNSPILRDSLEHSDSALLANLIFVTWTIFLFHSEPLLKGKLCNVSSITLHELSKIDVRLASTEMQNVFCHLWNILVRHHAQVRTQNGSGSYAPVFTEGILLELHRSFNVLHQSTDATLSCTSTDDDSLITRSGAPYRLCRGHHHTSSQSPYLTNVNLRNPPSSRPPLSTPLDFTPPNPVVGETGASDALDVPPLAEATFHPVVDSLSPTHLPQAGHPSANITPSVHDSCGQTRTLPTVVIGSPLLSSSDGAPAAPSSDLTSSP